MKPTRSNVLLKVPGANWLLWQMRHFIRLFIISICKLWATNWIRYHKFSIDRCAFIRLSSVCSHHCMIIEMIFKWKKNEISADFCDSLRSQISSTSHTINLTSSIFSKVAGSMIYVHSYINFHCLISLVCVTHLPTISSDLLTFSLVFARSIHYNRPILLRTQAPYRPICVQFWPRLLPGGRVRFLFDFCRHTNFDRV